MKRLKIGLICAGLLICLASVGITGYGVFLKVKKGLEAWEETRCWDRVGQSLEGKEFEIDVKTKKLKPQGLMTSEDYQKALWVFDRKLAQANFVLETLEMTLKDSKGEGP